MSAAKKVTIKPPELPYEAEKAKKIYRSVCEIIKRLDNVQNKKNVFRDAFLPEVIFLRDRLQEYCEKLMFSWPLEYGRKVEEVIWRKGFYDVIQLVKRNIKEVRMDGGIDKAFKTHLASGIGYYTRLLLKIQSKFDVQLDDIIDLGVMITSDLGTSDQTSKPETKTAIKNWATQACFRSLIYLGDIARYQHDYDGATKMIAQRYYHQALMVCPGLGMPYNQLGTLAGMNAYGFHAAYFYVRCLVSSAPFEGTNNNLLKLFEKNRMKLSELEAVDDGNRSRLPHNFHYRHPRKNALSYARSKDNKRFLLRFIHLVELFFTSSKDCEKTHVHELCQVVLDDFDKCLRSNLCSRNPTSSKRDRGQSSEEKQNAVDDEVVFKIFVVCLASIHHLSKKGHDLVASAIAFSLAMFSHSLNSIVTRLRPQSLDELDPEETCSNPAAGHQRKYASLRIAASECSVIAEENPAEVGGGDRVGRVKGRGGDSDANREDEDEEDADGAASKGPEKVPASQVREDRKTRRSTPTSRKRTRGSDDDDADDDDNDDESGDGDDNDADNLSSEVESEGALSDFDLLSSSDEGSGMESQPEDEEREREEEPVRAPAYHKKADGAAVGKGILANKKPTKEVIKEEEPESPKSSEDPIVAGNGNRGLEDKLFVARKDEDTKADDSIDPFETDRKNEANMDEVSGTWMSDAASFLGRTLKMSYFEREGDFEASDVVAGNRNVPVPPGFESSLESRHVMEITEKLANFNIETDTDVNQSDGDETLGDHSDAEVELEMEKKRQENRRKEVSRILNLVLSERMLEHVKIFLEWMIINPLIVTSCAKISSSIWYRLAALLNLLPSEKDLVRSDLCTKSKNFSGILVTELRSETDPDRRLFPLMEDIHLMEFPPLKAAHQKVDFDLEEFVNEKQEAAVRLCRIRMFCRSLSTLEGIDFNYDREADSFRGPSVIPSSRKRTESQEETSKASVMKNLAQLRVKSQAGRDRSIRELAPHGFPVYLVPDTESIYEGLKLMKRLTQNEKLKVVVPKVVLAFLDSIKTTSRMTMKAIEWVEGEIYKNDQSRMRLQKPTETCLFDSSADAKQNKDDYILRIVDCCLYLSTHNASPPAGEPSVSSEGRNSVCLLTWMTADNPELSERAKGALADAVEKGIKIKTVGEFFHQLQQLSSIIP